MQVVLTDKFIQSIPRPTNHNAVIIKDKAPIVRGAPGALYIRVGKTKTTWNLRYGSNGNSAKMRIGFYPAVLAV